VSASSPILRDGEAPAPVPAEVARAVVRTVAYAALFQAPLTLDRLHRALMDVRLDPMEIEEALADPWVRERVDAGGGLVRPRGRDEWLPLREERRRHTFALLGRHRRALGLLARFPFVRMVGLSGACAHENASDDDVDVFLVARAGRAWCMYLGLVAASRLLGVRRTLCVNYVVDEGQLRLAEHDVFTASELVALRPLAGREAYCRFVQQNDWVGARFPNFVERHASDAAAVPPAGAPRWLEGLLDLGPAPLFEWLSRRIMGARIRRKARGSPAVVLGSGRLKLHVFDHRRALLDRWEEAQRQAGLPPREEGR
jgi:hypothetical protein